MKKYTVVLSALFLMMYSQNAFSWGMKGHDVICCIADNHLTPKAHKKIAELLDGHSIVYYASWLDQIRGNDIYEESYTWHYANIDEGETYETMTKNPKGDILTALSYVTEKLTDPNSSDSVRSQYLKYIVHLMGDLHCPMHAGRLSDLGGNRYYITFFGRETNLHSIWDDAMIEGVRKWSYTEWCRHIDMLSKKQVEELVQGEYYDWFMETSTLCKELYMKTPEGGNVSYDYLFGHFDTIVTQFQKAGYRLASVLNSIFG